MSGVAHQAFDGDETNALPRFLSRDDGLLCRVSGTSGTTLQPPPLPRAPWPVRVRRLATLALALVVVVPAAMALVAEGGRPKINPSQPESGAEARDQVTDALQIVAQLEARLGYAGNLAGTYQEAAASGQPGPNRRDQRAEATVSPTPSSEAPDPVGLLILRNLPESVTFSAGGPVGKGAWAMPAGDPNQLVMTLGDGFDKPVTADVEMISQAGLTLGSLRLELRKDGEAAAVAKTVAAPLETGSIASTGDDEDKPAKRTRRVRTRNHDTVAHAEGTHKKRVKRVAIPAKVKVPEAADGDDDKDNSNAAKVEVEQKKPGPLTKFFSWLKGEPKPP